jgi:hypothetical protein
MAYLGTVYGHRNLRGLLQALRAFLDRNPAVAVTGAQFRIAGSLEGVSGDSFPDDVATLGLQGAVEYLGVLPRRAALEVLARSRLAVVLAQDQQYQVPAKLYELAGMGIPTLVIASNGSATSSEAHRLGATPVTPEDVASMVGKMEDIWLGRATRTVASDAVLDYSQLAEHLSGVLSGAGQGSLNLLSRETSDPSDFQMVDCEPGTHDAPSLGKEPAREQGTVS